MRFLAWLAVPLVFISLVCHIGLYTTYLFDFPWRWSVLLIAGLMLLATISLALLKTICRLVFPQVKAPDWITHMLRQLAYLQGIQQPALYYLSSDGINAFALGDLRRSGVIFFHTQMLAHLTQDEVESVLAHELSHLASGHAMVMTFLQGMTGLLIAPLALLAGAFLSLVFGIRNFKQYFIQIYHSLSILLFPVTTLLIALVMREWEYSADARAAHLVGKAKYIAALQCLHGSFFQHPDLLSLSAGRAGSDKDQWALSHPSLKQRIRALRELG